MKWYCAYAVLESDGLVRLPSWDKDEYVCLASEVTEDGVLYLMNQDGAYVELTELELRSDEWEEVTPYEKPIEERTDEELLLLVKATCEAKLNYQMRLLVNRLRLFAQRNEDLPNWSDDNLKYYIVWSGINDGYYIESTYKDYYCGMVHFNSRSACWKAIKAHRPMLDLVRDLDYLLNDLSNSNHTRDKLMKTYDYLINLQLKL